MTSEAAEGMTMVMIAALLGLAEIGCCSEATIAKHVGWDVRASALDRLVDRGYVRLELAYPKRAWANHPRRGPRGRKSWVIKPAGREAAVRITANINTLIQRLVRPRS
jgi:hypothetical protein